MKMYNFFGTLLLPCSLTAPQPRHGRRRGPSQRREEARARWNQVELGGTRWNCQEIAGLDFGSSESPLHGYQSGCRSSIRPVELAKPRARWLQREDKVGVREPYQRKYASCQQEG